MAIVQYSEHWLGAGSTSDQTSGTSTRVIDVLVDGFDAPFEHLIIERSPLFPQEFQVHPLNPFLFVANKSAVASPGPKLYRLTVTYGSIGDPTKIAPQVEWTFATSSEQIDRDFEGKAITNSSGETSDPPITDEKDDQVYRTVFNSFTFDANLAAQYKGAVNSDPWFGFEAEHAKVINFSGSFNGVDTVPFWTITIEVQVRFVDTWAIRFLDQGFREKTGVDADGKATYLTLKDTAGDPLSQPTLLDGKGVKLKDGLDPVFNEIWTRPRLPFIGVIPE